MTEVLQPGAKMTEEILIASARLHNHFSPDTAFPQIDQHSDGFEELGTILAKHNAHRHFRLRLLHRHTIITEGQILLGATITEPPGFWTTPTPISDVDLHQIHPHIISADVINCSSEGDMGTDRLFPSEFREGEPSTSGNISSNFFKEFIDCLRANKLENIFGLEVVQGQSGKMIEFSFDAGSLLLEEQEVKAEFRQDRAGQFKLQETGWTITVKDGTVCKTGETRCVTYSTGHIKFTDSKVKGASDAVKILRDQGVLVS